MLRSRSRNERGALLLRPSDDRRSRGRDRHHRHDVADAVQLWPENCLRPGVFPVASSAAFASAESFASSAESFTSAAEFATAAESAAESSAAESSASAESFTAESVASAAEFATAAESSTSGRRVPGA